MSLISDALRRARQENSGDGGEGTRLPSTLQPPPRRRGPSLAAVLIVALVAAVVGAGMAWFVVHRRAGSGEPVARAGELVPTAVAPTPAPAVTPDGPVPRDGAVPATEPARRESGIDASARRASEPAGARPAAGGTVGTSGGVGATAAPSSAGPGRETGAGGRGTAPPRGGYVVARPVSDEARRVGIAHGNTRKAIPAKIPTPIARAVPTRKAQNPEARKKASRPREIIGSGTVDGVKLNLDYLVYRATDPFAQINGVEVHVGGEVDGFTVVAIHEDDVRLQGRGGPVILRVH